MTRVRDPAAKDSDLGSQRVLGRFPFQDGSSADLGAEPGELAPTPESRRS